MVQVDNWSELCEVVTELEKEWDTRVWFRGQNSNWPLIPKLYRKNGKANVPYGYQAFVDFQLESSSYVNVAKLDTFAFYTLAQHYGLATRLLDWSKALFSALYFAVEGLDGLEDLDAEDKRIAFTPVIHCLNPGILNELHVGERKVINALSGLCEQYASVSEESDVKKVIAVHPRWDNQRISVQQGMFTIHGGIDSPIDMQCPAAVRSIFLNPGKIGTFDHHLEVLGINRATIYRDLGAFCQVLNDIHILT
jgi:hypothetical protein